MVDKIIIITQRTRDTDTVVTDTGSSIYVVVVASIQSCGNGRIIGA